MRLNLVFEVELDGDKKRHIEGRPPSDI